MMKMKLRQWLAWLLAAALLCGPFALSEAALPEEDCVSLPAEPEVAELGLIDLFEFGLDGGDDDIEYTAEQLAEMEAEEKEAEEDIAAVVEGEIYEEKKREDFNMNSPALYTAKMRTDFVPLPGT